MGKADEREGVRLMNKFAFGLGVGLLLLGLGMAMLGHDTPTQIRGLAEMIVGLKTLDMCM